MRAGIAAGSISAVVAAIVSLPLRSPDDILLNSATVVMGALLTGFSAGVVWRFLAGNSRAILIFAILGVAAFAITAVVSLAAETQLDHFAAFVLPLGGIVFLLTGLQIPLFHRIAIPAGWWTVSAALAIALAVGAGLAGQGDGKTGKLVIPPRGAVAPAEPMAERSLLPDRRLSVRENF
ncbi:MAG: hypothetical protein BZY88_08270 [SAR202 cluster bacterium Io17-Chloro-G9]|nr:MAG: hypothetical protein BZY88_08270 [SAR202 cluster bacterium Io17-Chloro-G9]